MKEALMSQVSDRVKACVEEDKALFGVVTG